MSRYAVVSTVPEMGDRVRTAAAGELEGDVHAWQGEAFPTEPHELLSELPDANLLDVVVLGPGVPLDSALRLASDFEVQRPEVTVLLVAPPSPDLVLAAMRAGIRDVLEPEADVSNISALLHRATRSAAIRRRAGASPEQGASGGSGGRIIVVVSPKGGAGKTTVATNLAIGLAGAAPHGTVLVDLDLQFGDVANALSIVPDHSLTDAVYGPASRDIMVLKSFLSAHPSGLYALCAPESPAEADEITADEVSNLLDQLASQYRYVVVDTSPGLTDHTLATLEKATDICFVIGMDVPSVRGMRKELEILRELGIAPTTRHTVLNSADLRTGLSVKDIESTLGVAVDIVIPPSRAIGISTNQGTPLMQGRRRDSASKAMRKLVSRFAPASAHSPKIRSSNNAKGRHRIGTL